jgi:hypothetical protein
VAQKEFRLGADQPLRQAARLDQKEPVIARGCGLLVDRLEAVERRHDVEQRQALDALGWSRARRWATRAPRSWPATAKRSKPSAAIISTWSRANARFE